MLKQLPLSTVEIKNISCKDEMLANLQTTGLVHGCINAIIEIMTFEPHFLTRIIFLCRSIYFQSDTFKS